MLLHFEELNLKSAVDNSLLILRNRFQEKGVTEEIDIADDLEVLVDQVSFVNSVLNNLLTNAVKFSNKGDTVTVRATETKDGYVKIAVIDRGIGIFHKIARLGDIQPERGSG